MSSLHFLQQLLAIDPYGRRFSDLIKRLEASSSFDGTPFLLGHPGLSASDRKALDQIRPSLALAAEQSGARLLSAEEAGLDWRSLGCPPFFFAKGGDGDFKAPRVAIVGTRGASTYGRAAAAKFAEKLVEAGVTIVSGGAFGIDAASHKGAIDAGGRTWTILPTGLDQLYPASHKGLFDQVSDRGLLISQFPLGEVSFEWNFVIRNHTIAAFSSAVIIIEAPEKSGSLHTARAAAEMGREVFVVPGPISNPQFRGSHALIRDGAVLVDHPDQVLEALRLQAAFPPAPAPAQPDGPAGQILGHLEGGPMRLEALGEALELDPGELLSELTMMELEGLVMRGPEGYVKL